VSARRRLGQRGRDYPLLQPVVDLLLLVAPLLGRQADLDLAAIELLVSGRAAAAAAALVAAAVGAGAHNPLLAHSGAVLGRVDHLVLEGLGGGVADGRGARRVAAACVCRGAVDEVAGGVVVVVVVVMVLVVVLVVAEWLGTAAVGAARWHLLLGFVGAAAGALGQRCLIVCSEKGWELIG